MHALVDLQQRRARGSDCEEVLRVLVFYCVMEASSESTSSSPSALFVESDIRDLKNEIKKLKQTVNTIDTDGGRRLENVDRDSTFLRKELKRAVKRSENVFLGLMAELEIKMEKLELKVLKMEVANCPGSLSRLKEENNQNIFVESIFEFCCLFVKVCFELFL